MSLNTLTVLLTLLSPAALAGSNSQSFTYQGRFLNAAGTAPLKDTVDLKFSIYDPAGDCLLYQENQTNIDLTSSNGVFATQVGSASGSSKRTSLDPALSMSQIFSNGAAAVRAPGTNCSSGYTPASGDARVLRVVVTPHSTSVGTTISPDLTINSVPQAQTADLIQGLAPTDLIQSASGVSGQSNVSLATLIGLTNSTDASALHHHDGRYVRTGSGSTYANLGSGAYTSSSFGIGTSTPSGNLGFAGNNGTQTIEVERNSTSNTAGNSLSLSAGGATSGASNKSGGSLVLSSGVSTGSAGSAISFQTSTAGSSGSSDNALSTKMTLASDGKLGVGNAAPGAQLEVDSSSATTIGAIIKGFTSQVADLFQAQDSTGLVVAKIAKDGAMTIAGPLTLPGNPTSSLQAVTKQYVDSAIAASTTGVATFNTRTGNVTLTSGDVTTALNYTPLKNTTDTLTGILTVTGALSAGGAVGSNTQFQSTSSSATNIGAVVKGAASQSADLLQFQNNSGAVLSKVDAAGMVTLAANPTSTLQAATKAYVDSVVSSSQPSGNYITALTGDVTATGPSSAAATVASVGGSTAALVHSAELAANAGTSSNTANALIKRDASGNFSAGIITANLSGAASANVLKSGDSMTGTLTSAPTTDVIELILKDSSSQTNDLIQFQNNSGTVLSKFDSSGMLTLPANPTSTLQAATKGYVDSAVASGSANWAAPGTIGSTTPNTGAFSTLSAGQINVITVNANAVGATIQGSASQTADLIDVKNSSGTNVFAVNASGVITTNITAPSASFTGYGAVGGYFASGRQFSVTATAATNVVEVLTSASSQTADLLQFQDSSSSVLSTFNSKGYLGLGTASPVSLLTITATPAASNVTGLASIGEGGFAGSGGNFAGSANGTEIAVNSSSSFAGNLIDLQKGGTSKFAVTNSGAVTATSFAGDGSGLTNIGSSAVNWSVPGTIGATTANTGKFTTLTSTGAATLNSLGVTANETISGTFAVTGASTLAAVTATNVASSGKLTLTATPAPAVSSAGQGVVYFDSTSNTFQVSQNGSSFSPLATTASVSAGYLPLAGGTLTGALATTTLTTNGATVVNGATADNSAAALNVKNSAGTSELFVRNDGNVGMGTTSPAAALHVNGSSMIVGSSATAAGSFIYNSNGGGNSYMGIVDSGNVYGISRYLPAPSGTSTLGGYYAGLGIGGSTTGVGNPIFGVLTSNQSANGLGNVAMTIYDNNKIVTYNNTLDAGDGSAIFGGTALKIPAAATSGSTVKAGRSIASTNGSTVNTASGTSLAVDMSIANVQIYSYNSGDGGSDPGTNTVTVSLSNMVSGGSYTLILDNSANNSTPTFVLSGCTGKYVPSNGATTASTQSVYSILYVVRGGTGYCYTSWITGF